MLTFVFSLFFAGDASCSLDVESQAKVMRSVATSHQVLDDIFGQVSKAKTKTKRKWIDVESMSRPNPFSFAFAFAFAFQ